MQITPQTSLEDWNAEAILTLLDRDEGEGYFHDFKTALNAPDPSHNRNIRKAAASFANTSGGFLVFGVKDKAQAAGRERFIGISDVSEFAKQLTNKLSGNEVVPPVAFEGPRVIPIEHSGSPRNVVVVRVPESQLKPHGISESGGPLEFWMRGNSTAVVAPYASIMKMVQESSDTRNWLAALYLDADYIDTFADQMVIAEAEREVSIPVVRITALINSDQSSQVIARIPTDVELIRLIWAVRGQIDMVNSFRDMMIALQATALSNAGSSCKDYNTRVAERVIRIKQLTKQIRTHLAAKYSGIREWLSVVRPPA